MGPFSAFSRILKRKNKEDKVQQDYMKDYR